ncbi:hypothetical protein H632_c732p3, partial [Helicosporidium sp. ATCC 50920]
MEEFIVPEGPGKMFTKEMAPPSARIDPRDAAWLATNLSLVEQYRETVAQRTREIRRLAKLAIASVQRCAFAEADGRIAEVEKAAMEVRCIVSAHPHLYSGTLSAAMEEYVEAVLFRHYVEEQRILPSTAIPLATSEQYMAGLMDVAGELGRFSLVRTSNPQWTAHVYGTIASVYTTYSEMDSRNEPGRRKCDVLRYMLRAMGIQMGERPTLDPFQAAGPPPEGIDLRLQQEGVPALEQQAGGAGKQRYVVPASLYAPRELFSRLPTEFERAHDEFQGREPQV